MHNTAQGWLVYDLTRSSAWLGVVGFLSFMPYSIFALWGGSVADRLDKRRLLVMTHMSALVLALIYAVSVWGEWINIAGIATLAFGLGMISAFDSPARQAFVIDLVGKEDLQNGIALNSAMFNAARLLGPALAGIVIAKFGVAWCLFANAASFLPAIITLLRLRLPAATARPQAQAAPFWRAQREIWHYLRHTPVIAGLLLLVGITTIFGWSFVVVLPVFAEEILRGGALELGRLLSASGLGALASALTVAVLSHRFRPRQLLMAGLAIYVLAIAVFALSQHPWLSRAALTLVGFGLIMFYVNCNTALQRRVPDHLRGRVMGVYVMCYGGLMPVGSLQVGLVSARIGAPAALLLNAAMCALAGGIAFKVFLRYAAAGFPASRLAAIAEPPG